MGITQATTFAGENGNQLPANDIHIDNTPSSFVFGPDGKVPSLASQVGSWSTLLVRRMWRWPVRNANRPYEDGMLNACTLCSANQRQGRTLLRYYCPDQGRIVCLWPSW